MGGGGVLNCLRQRNGTPLNIICTFGILAARCTNIIRPFRSLHHGLQLELCSRNLAREKRSAGCRTLQDGEGSVSSDVPGISLPAMPWSDWEILPSEIQICRRPNGQEWELGSGSFGKVHILFSNSDAAATIFG